VGTFATTTFAEATHLPYDGFASGAELPPRALYLDGLAAVQPLLGVLAHRPAAEDADDVGGGLVLAVEAALYRRQAVHEQHDLEECATMGKRDGMGMMRTTRAE
jgi:hypothetical protein